MHVGMWNAGSLSGKRDVCDEVRKGLIYVSCLHGLR